jgi:general secretion pathway protein F/type IV pilus assembly protein PilC
LQPLPAVIGGDFTLVHYLLAAGRTLLVFAAFLIGFAGLYRSLQGRQARKANGLDRMRLSIPLLGAHHQRVQIVTLLSAFEMLYATGLPPDRAISIVLRTLSNGCIRESFSRARSAFTQGKSVTAVFIRSPYLPSLARELIKAGDVVGDLTESLRRYGAIESESLSQADKAFANWIPRLVYVLVAGWMATSLF